MQSEIRESVMDAIGNTPVVRLERLFPAADVVAKLEYMNPGGSIMDRMVRYLLRHLPAGTTRVVESSTGNTGAALAMASAVLGLECEVAVPETTSIEKIQRIGAYGARVHLCAGDEAGDERSCQAVAARIARERGAFLIGQHASELNRLAHYHDTAPELWRQLGGQVDVFVCGIGTGGTISGIGRYLKEQDPKVRVIGVEPLNSAYRKVVTDRPAAGRFDTVIEGVGQAEAAPAFDPAVVDDVVQVPDGQALAWCRALATEEGILAGGSSGCVVAGIAEILPRFHGARVAAVLPDSGAYYLSKYF